ncbi:MAG TPA: hypothetical protein VKE94_21175 [Gemmataceae bacterium]|nr:hypothetical protein [Gemmataceae bacterium]
MTTKPVLLLALLALFATCLTPAGARGGYTHYFTWRQKPEGERLKACLGDMEKVVNAAKGMLAGPDGYGRPVLRDAQLQFNGRGEEDSHEPFIFPGQVGFNFCKTQGKPYDAAVVACLLVACDHFPAEVLEIASDSKWNQGDWDDGSRLYQAVFNRKPQNPMSSTSSGQGWPKVPEGTRLLPTVILIGGTVFFVLWVIRRRIGSSS